MLIKLLPVLSSPVICSGELHPRANIGIPCDVTKVRGFVCLPPPNYPLGEKMRRKCRLIRVSPSTIVLGIRIALQGCRIPAEVLPQKTGRSLWLAAAQHGAVGPRDTGWTRAPITPCTHKMNHRVSHSHSMLPGKAGAS